MASNHWNNPGGANTPPKPDFITNAVACYGAIYVAPTLYYMTERYAYQFLQDRYGDDLASYGLLAHMAMCFAISFLGIRGTMSIAIALLTMATGRYGLHFSNILPFAF